METVATEFEKEFDDIKEALTIDGVRLRFEDNSWVLIRPSGTEPYI
jgi:phosphoglucosamine mutase